MKKNHILDMSRNILLILYRLIICCLSILSLSLLSLASLYKHLWLATRLELLCQVNAAWRKHATSTHAAYRAYYLILPEVHMFTRPLPLAIKGVACQTSSPPLVALHCALAYIASKLNANTDK